VSGAAESAPSGEGVLTVQVHGADGEPELLWVLSRAPAGMVRVREWSRGSWAGEGVERLLPPGEVWAAVHGAYERRRRVGVEMAELRAWLDAIPR
jgi:hypothetical protein